MITNAYTETAEQTYVEEKLQTAGGGGEPRKPNLQNLWHVLDTPVLIVSNDGFLLAANPAARLLLKLDENAPGGTLFSALVPRGQKESFQKAMELALMDRVAACRGTLTTREHASLPVEVVFKAGQWAEMSVLYAFCHDLRNRDELEGRIDTLQRQLDEALDTASAFQWRMAADVNGKMALRHLSASASRVTGYSVDEALSQFQNWLDIVHPEDRAEVEDQYKMRMLGRRREPLEYRILGRNGALRWVHDTLEERRIQAGRVHLAGQVRDITERKRAEEIRQQSNEQLLGWINELKQRSNEAGMLNEMGDLLQSAMGLDDVWMVVRRFALELFRGYSGAIYLLQPSLHLLESVLAWGESPPEALDFRQEQCWALRRNRVVTGGGPNSVQCQHVDGSGAAHLCVPMTVQTETLGVFHLCSRSEEPLEHLTQLALMFSSRVALALSNLRLSETLRQQSIRDPLTTLYNRRYLEEMLTRELRRAVRHGRPIGLVMADIDHFKDFNDRFGHAAGDAVLREVSRFLQTQVRGEDIVCRFGGEEFIVVLVEASLDDTEKRADLLRQGAAGLALRYGEVDLGTVTLSFGVSGFPRHGRTVQSLVEAADNALYRAKQAGRNCVVRAG